VNEIKIGFAICASFCTFPRIMPILESLCKDGADVTAVFSEMAYGTDTRFGKAADWVARAEAATGKPVICTIAGAEPIGPEKRFDIIIASPATGNTIAKLANGITDTAVTMACKSHLRNRRPILLGVSTNDGLSASHANIGILMNRKNIFFVPYRQDDSLNKPNSLVAEFEQIPALVRPVLQGVQAQPVLLT